MITREQKNFDNDSMYLLKKCSRKRETYYHYYIIFLCGRLCNHETSLIWGTFLRNAERPSICVLNVQLVTQWWDQGMLHMKIYLGQGWLFTCPQSNFSYYLMYLCVLLKWSAIMIAILINFLCIFNLLFCSMWLFFQNFLHLLI